MRDVYCENASLRIQVGALETQYDELCAQVDELCAQVKELQTDYELLHDDCSTAVAGESLALELIAELETENAKLRARVEELEELYRQACIEAHEAAGQRNALQAALDAALEIINSEHVKAVESIARIHGYHLDQETALRFQELWEIINKVQTK